ncbi:MAG: ComF family protein [Bacteroidaceae bacterium]
MSNWLTDLKELIYPHLCPWCGNPIHKEQAICTDCYLKSVSNEALLREKAELKIISHFPIERAFSFFQYDNSSRQLALQFKYHGQKDLALNAGRMMANSLLLTSDFFSEIDCLIPVPLHPRRQKERGYNQSEYLAKGISEQTGIPIRTDLVERIHYTTPQAQLTHEEREENVRNIFRGIPQKTDSKEQHWLVIDDVMTTGSTLIECLKAIREKHEAELSVLTLFIT